MEPADLHQRVRDGVNTGDLDLLVSLYEADAVLVGEDGAPAQGAAAIRATYEGVVSFGGTLSLHTRYVVESGELAMLSNEFTFSMPGYSATWITAEVARRQSDGTWKYVIDNPYASRVDDG